jgi:hypothetical protein
MEIVVVLVGVLVLPVALYAYASSPHAWGMIRDGTVRLRGGAYRGYRETTESRWIEGRAPLVVRIAAFTSFCLGQMIIPGVPAAIFGAIIACMSLDRGELVVILIGLILSAPTGIIVASRLLGSGLRLLQRAPFAAERARLAAKWELVHNVALFLFLTVVLGVTSQEREARSFMFIPLALSVVAILHAGLLLAAANALDAYDAAAEEAEPAIPA